MTNDFHRHKDKRKWATVTNVGKDVYHLTKLFKRKSECGTKNQKQHQKNPE